MPYGMYISASGAEAQSRRIEVLTNNLANADTPGFRRSLAVLQARDSEAIERGLDHTGSGSINDLGGGVSMSETVTDFAPGSIRTTNSFTDMSIQDDGRGFFVVEKDGQQLLTRAGNFHFASNGELQTPSGYSVLDVGDNPITKNPNTSHQQFNSNGTITQGDQSVQLKLVKANSKGDLVRVGENMFSSLAETIPLTAEERKVANKSVELSSVKSATEMMHLIEASRAYEANVRLIQHQDQMVGTLVNRVLKQS